MIAIVTESTGKSRISGEPTLKRIVDDFFANHHAWIEAAKTHQDAKARAAKKFLETDVGKGWLEYKGIKNSNYDTMAPVDRQSVSEKIWEIAGSEGKTRELELESEVGALKRTADTEERLGDLRLQSRKVLTDHLEINHAMGKDPIGSEPAYLDVSKDGTHIEISKVVGKESHTVSIPRADLTPEGLQQAQYRNHPVLKDSLNWDKLPKVAANPTANPAPPEASPSSPAPVGEAAKGAEEAAHAAGAKKMAGAFIDVMDADRTLEAAQKASLHHAESLTKGALKEALKHYWPQSARNISDELLSETVRLMAVNPEVAHQRLAKVLSVSPGRVKKLIEQTEGWRDNPKEIPEALRKRILGKLAHEFEAALVQQNKAENAFDNAMRRLQQHFPGHEVAVAGDSGRRVVSISGNNGVLHVAEAECTIEKLPEFLLAEAKKDKSILKGHAWKIQEPDVPITSTSVSPEGSVKNGARRNNKPQNRKTASQALEEEAEEGSKVRRRTRSRSRRPESVVERTASRGKKAKEADSWLEWVSKEFETHPGRSLSVVGALAGTAALGTWLAVRNKDREDDGFAPEPTGRQR